MTFLDNKGELRRLLMFSLVIFLFSVFFSYGLNIGGTDEGYFQGIIDEISIWNTSFSDEEAWIDYRSSFTLINMSYWEFGFNATNMSLGNYTYQAFIYGVNDTPNWTEKRLLTIEDVNHLPNITDVRIPSPTMYTNDLTCEANVTDDLGTDTVYVNWTLYKNGIFTRSGQQQNITLDSYNFIIGINASETTATETWTCSVRAFNLSHYEDGWTNVSVYIGHCGDGTCNYGETTSSCSADCTSGGGGDEEPDEYCGDGSCNGDETCATCEDDCGVCQICGNGVIEGTEACDSNTQACTINGYPGSGKCLPDCSGFSNCTTTMYCGDNIINGLEVCDGNTAGCTLGGFTGTKTCLANCLGYGNCSVAQFCGNGVIEGSEVCDSNTQVCTINGYPGTKTCLGTCLGFGNCTTTQYCGDGICNGIESFDTCFVDCSSVECGDGVCEGDEDCSNCASDCGECTFCGDGSCNGDEDKDSCPVDCDEEEEKKEDPKDEKKDREDAIAATDLVCSNHTLTQKEFFDTDMFDIPDGFEIIKGPFSVDCYDSYALLKFSVSDEFDDLRLLKSSGGDSQGYFLRNTTVSDCGTHIKEIARTETKYEPEAGDIGLEEINVSIGELMEAIKAEDDTALYFGDIFQNLSIEQDYVKDEIELPKNTRLKILSKPINVKLKDVDKDPEQEIKISYSNTTNVDESSIAIYTYINDSWQYVGGQKDNEARQVSVDINVSQYADENNTATFALMGLLCDNCFSSSFEKIYDYPGSRAAVILVHGFGSSPKTFEPLINEFEVSKQKIQLWTFGYPSSKSFGEIVTELMDHLERNSDSYDSIHIVSHSLGGLIAQQALYRAVEANKKAKNSFVFADKVKTIILAGVPNEGSPIVKLYKDIYNELINKEGGASLFNVNSVLMENLTSGVITPKEDDVNYYVVAGTDGLKNTEDIQKYFGGLPNDGVVNIKSAQHIGDEYLDNQCLNYWEVNLSHTELIDNQLSRKLISKVLSDDINKYTDDHIFGGSLTYFEAQVSQCSLDDVFVLIGRYDPKPFETELCSCGDGICGVGEDKYTCPSDCANFILLSAKSAPYSISLLILFVLLMLLTFYLGRRWIIYIKIAELAKIQSDKSRKKKIDSYIGGLKSDILDLIKHDSIAKKHEKDLLHMKSSSISKVRKEIKSEKNVKEKINKIEKSLKHLDSLPASHKLAVNSRINELKQHLDEYKSQIGRIHADIHSKLDKIELLKKKIQTQDKREKELVKKEKQRKSELKRLEKIKALKHRSYDLMRDVRNWIVRIDRRREKDIIYYLERLSENIDIIHKWQKVIMGHAYADIHINPITRLKIRYQLRNESSFLAFVDHAGKIVKSYEKLVKDQKTFLAEYVKLFSKEFDLYKKLGFTVRRDILNILDEYVLVKPGLFRKGRKDIAKNEAAYLKIENRRASSLGKDIRLLRNNIRNISKHKHIAQKDITDLKHIKTDDINKIKDEISSEKEADKHIRRINRKLKLYKTLVDSGKTSLNSKVRILEHHYEHYRSEIKKHHHDIHQKLDELLRLHKKQSLAKARKKEQLLKKKNERLQLKKAERIKQKRVRSLSFARKVRSFVFAKDILRKKEIEHNIDSLAKSIDKIHECESFFANRDHRSRISWLKIREIRKDLKDEGQFLAFVEYLKPIIKDYDRLIEAKKSYLDSYVELLKDLFDLYVKLGLTKRRDMLNILLDYEKNKPRLLDKGKKALRHEWIIFKRKQRSISRRLQKDIDILRHNIHKLSNYEHLVDRKVEHLEKSLIKNIGKIKKEIKDHISLRIYLKQLKSKLDYLNKLADKGQTYYKAKIHSFSHHYRIYRKKVLAYHEKLYQKLDKAVEHYTVKKKPKKEKLKSINSKKHYLISAKNIKRNLSKAALGLGRYIRSSSKKTITPLKRNYAIFSRKASKKAEKNIDAFVGWLQNYRKTVSRLNAKLHNKLVKILFVEQPKGLTKKAETVKIKEVPKPVEKISSIIDEKKEELRKGTLELDHDHSEIGKLLSRVKRNISGIRHCRKIISDHDVSELSINTIYSIIAEIKDEKAFRAELRSLYKVIKEYRKTYRNINHNPAVPVFRHLLDSYRAIGYSIRRDILNILREELKHRKRTRYTSIPHIARFRIKTKQQRPTISIDQSRLKKQISRIKRQKRKAEKKRLLSELNLFLEKLSIRKIRIRKTKKIIGVPEPEPVSIKEHPTVKIKPKEINDKKVQPKKVLPKKCRYSSSLHQLKRDIESLRFREKDERENYDERILNLARKLAEKNINVKYRLHKLEKAKPHLKDKFSDRIDAVENKIEQLDEIKDDSTRISELMQEIEQLENDISNGKTKVYRKHPDENKDSELVQKSKRKHNTFQADELDRKISEIDEKIKSLSGAKPYVEKSWPILKKRSNLSNDAPKPILRKKKDGSVSKKLDDEIKGFEDKIAKLNKIIEEKQDIKSFEGYINKALDDTKKGNLRRYKLKQIKRQETVLSNVHNTKLSSKLDDIDRKISSLRASYEDSSLAKASEFIRENIAKESEGNIKRKLLDKGFDLALVEELIFLIKNG